MSFMETLKAKDRRLVGLMGCLAIVFLIVGLARLGAMSVGQSTYVAELANTGGLRDGDPVQMAGVTVGRVTSMRLAGDRIEVTFEVDDEVHVGTRTRMEVELSTLLGGRYARLVPSSGDPGTDRIELANTSVPFDLPKALEVAAPDLEELDGKKLRSAMTALSKTFKAGSPAIQETLDGLTGLSDVITRRQDQLIEVISSADAVTTMVNENSADLIAIMGQSDSVIRALLARRELLTSVIDQTGTLSKQVAAVVGKNRPEIKRLVEQLVAITSILRRSDDSLDRALELFPPAARYLNNMVGNGPYIDIYFQHLVLPDNLMCLVGVVEGCK